MSKKIKNCFYKNLTFEKLYEAHLRARKHKTYKTELINFELNLENNIINLQNKILSNTYHVGKYHSFKIYEPKERIIKALPYTDRIVHQWYVEEFIKPYIMPKFVNTTFACIPERGTHKAVVQVQKYMRKFKQNYGDFWILKCDIKKFFYSIDSNILFKIMQKYISDTKLLEFTKLLIFDGRPEKEVIGIPIGNYTSQFFANIYLNELDQFIKRTLYHKYYVRYMDDFIILLKTKKECILLLNKISKFLNTHLHLELNSKSKYYPYSMGVNFCGYRIFTTHILLRTNSKKKMNKNVNVWNHLYDSHKLDLNFAMQSLNSWLGHVEHCNSYKLKNKIISNCNFLINAKYYSKLERYLITAVEQDSS